MIYFLLVLFGLAIGSFVSVVSYRIPRNLGFVKGRSFCDNCKKDLMWYDNIPLFSFLFYRGVSRCCNKKISIRYPAIEVTSLLGVLVTWIIFHNMTLVILFLLSLCIFIIDLEHQIIPDELSWLVLVLGLMANSQSLMTVLFPAFFLSLLLLTLHLVTSGRGMGLGDVKLSIALGLWLGLENGLTWIMVSFILGGIVSSVLLILKKANLKTKIAFGPFLIFAFWIIILWKTNAALP